MEYIIGAVIGLLVGAVLVYVFGVLRERKQADYEQEFRLVQLMSGF